ncbi:MAG: LysR family transcriptional regulator [Betaproteobacteria bacterium]|nr:LysR family transcriptional regulator [Betaproteobacteria bacterium]
MALSFKQLRAFCAVAELGSFSAAARRLSTTQSALSVMIKQLEKELQVTLIDRSTRRATLSIVGADFLSHATRVLEALDAVRTTSDAFQGSRPQRVNLASSLTYSASLIPQLLAQYARQFPGVTVRLLDGPDEKALARVVDGEADFAIAPQRATPTQLVQEPLFDDRRDIVCPRGHPLTRLVRPTWADALKYPFVATRPDAMLSLQADLHAFSPDLTLQPAYEVSEITTAIGLVSAGLGVVSLVSRADPFLVGFGLVRVELCDPVILRQCSILTPRGRDLSPAAGSLRHFIRSNLPDNLILRSSP